MFSTDFPVNRCHRHYGLPFRFLRGRREPAIVQEYPRSFSSLLRELVTRSRHRTMRHPAVMVVVDPWGLLTRRFWRPPQAPEGRSVATPHRTHQIDELAHAFIRENRTTRRF